MSSTLNDESLATCRRLRSLEALITDTVAGADPTQTAQVSVAILGSGDAVRVDAVYITYLHEDEWVGADVIYRHDSGAARLVLACEDFMIGYKGAVADVHLALAVRARVVETFDGGDL